MEDVILLWVQNTDPLRKPRGHDDAGLPVAGASAGRVRGPRLCGPAPRPAAAWPPLQHLEGAK
jgi:hypothetical protein